MSVRLVANGSEASKDLKTALTLYQGSGLSSSLYRVFLHLVADPQVGRGLMDETLNLKVWLSSDNGSTWQPYKVSRMTTLMGTGFNQAGHLIHQAYAGDNDLYLASDEIYLPADKTVKIELISPTLERDFSSGGTGCSATVTWSLHDTAYDSSTSRDDLYATGRWDKKTGRLTLTVCMARNGLLLSNFDDADTLTVRPLTGGLTQVSKDFTNGIGTIILTADDPTDVGATGLIVSLRPSVGGTWFASGNVLAAPVQMDNKDQPLQAIGSWDGTKLRILVSGPPSSYGSSPLLNGLRAITVYEISGTTLTAVASTTATAAAVAPAGGTDTYKVVPLEITPTSGFDPDKMHVIKASLTDSTNATHPLLLPLWVSKTTLTSAAPKLCGHVKWTASTISAVLWVERGGIRDTDLAWLTNVTIFDPTDLANPIMGAADYGVADGICTFTYDTGLLQPTLAKTYYLQAELTDGGSTVFVTIPVETQDASVITAGSEMRADVSWDGVNVKAIVWFEKDGIPDTTVDSLATLTLVQAGSSTLIEMGPIGAKDANGCFVATATADYDTIRPNTVYLLKATPVIANVGQPVRMVAVDLTSNTLQSVELRAGLSWNGQILEMALWVVQAGRIRTDIDSLHNVSLQKAADLGNSTAVPVIANTPIMDKRNPGSGDEVADQYFYSTFSLSTLEPDTVYVLKAEPIVNGQSLGVLSVATVLYGSSS